MRPFPRPRALLFACLSLALGACNKVAPLPDPATPAPAVESAGPPVTEQEAWEFAEKLAQALRAHDSAQINRLFHLSDLADRLLSDLPLSETAHRGVRVAIERALQSNGSSGPFSCFIASGGSYKPLRVHLVDGRPRVRFRVVAADESLDYHDYALARFPDGTVGVEDVYAFVAGEPFTQTLRRYVIPTFAEASGQLKGGPTRKDLAALGAMVQATRNGKPDEAIAGYQQLPPGLQDDKIALLNYAEALLKRAPADGSDFLAALEKFRTLFPGDATADLLALDYYVPNEQYEPALAALGRLSRAVGGDPYLEGMRGEMLMGLDRFDDARAAVERAIEQEPDSRRLYWTRITLSVREERFDETLAWLKKCARATSEPLPDFTEDEEFDDFVKSPQYREWQKWFKGQAKAPARK